MYEDGEPGIRAFSWVLNDGKVESSNVDFMRTVSGEVVSRPADFTWTYDAVNGQCTGVVYPVSYTHLTLPTTPYV